MYVWLYRAGDPDGGTESTVTQTSAAVRYADPALCQGCHSEIWQTYQLTGMGRSFYRPRPENVGTAQDGADGFYHDASDRYYRIIRRGDRYLQRRHQLDPRGSETNILEKEVHYVMGSGNHARSYLHLSASGKLTQLPLGWYAENGGTWAMSPGYDRRNHDGFQRVVSFDCMFCHNSYPDVPNGADLPGRRPLYRGSIPEGIDCQRCHGPGLAHVEAAGSGTADSASISASILNPGKLPPQRELEVCFQCHLEPTSRPLPNIVHRYGRGYFSYRPAEPLSTYALYFDHAGGTGWDGKFEINHSAYRLQQSRCFIATGETLTCTTCHDPHRPAHGDEASARYDAACRSCHEDRLASLAQAGKHNAAQGCAGCHMPQRRTEDVVHAVMTDHLIQAAPQPDLLRSKREQSLLAETAYRGEVELYYPATLDDPEDELYLAVAQVAQGSNRQEGLARLESAIQRHQPAEAGFYFELGAAYEEAGRFDEAVRWFERALARDPSFGLARIRLGGAQSQAGAHELAEETLRRAGELAPADPRVFRERGMNFARQGQFANSAEVSRAGIALDPDLPELHSNLGGALAELGRFEAAQSALREAVRLQPDLAEARFNLGTLLAAGGDSEGAVRQWREAIRSKPDYAAARYNYAVVLAADGDVGGALAQLDAALQAEPRFDRAREMRDDLRQAMGSEAR